MASAIIHIAITNNLNKKLKRDKTKILIGTIAPDIAKMLGETKKRSHFQKEDHDNIPRLNLFLKKYQKYLDDDFVLGYYIHLFVDYLWFKYFIPEIINNDKKLIKRLDGTIIKYNGDEFVSYLYNDYTNLNQIVIDKYNLDLKIFYNELPKFKNIITEIPMDKIDFLIDKMGLIIMESKKSKPFCVDSSSIENFIKTSTEIIEGNLELMGI